MIELSECIRLESQTLLYEKNVARRVRPDWRSRWSAMLPGPGAQAQSGRGSPRPKAETGRRADPLLGRTALRPSKG